LVFRLFFDQTFKNSLYSIVVTHGNSALYAILRKSNQFCIFFKDYISLLVK